MGATVEREGEQGVYRSEVAILDFLGQLYIYLLPSLVQFLDLVEEALAVQSDCVCHVSRVFLFLNCLIDCRSCAKTS